MTIFRDITAIKEIEKRLLEAQKLEAVGVLARGLAHDFNNLFTTIMGNILMAKSEIRGQKQATEHLEEAEAASSKAVALTRRLLSFTQEEEMDLVPVSLPELLKPLTVPHEKAAEITLVNTIRSDLWDCRLDLDLTQYALENILLNGYQAMPHGGTITISAKNLSIPAADGEYCFLSSGKYVHLTIRDEGSGIDSKELSKVFDPYYTTQERCADNGLGFGLTVSRAIITRQKGEITIESTPGEGTTVHLYLPAILPSPEENSPK